MGGEERAVKICGLLLVRSEDWVLNLCLDAALRWVDKVFVMLHKCVDASESIALDFQGRHPERIWIDTAPEDEHWQEMDNRDLMYRKAKEAFPDTTHFAMIDSDEVVTHNVIPQMRGWCEQLAPGQLLDLPMIAPSGSFTLYRADKCVWTDARITCAFRDADGLSWKPRGTYQHHNRNPHGCRPDRLSPLANVSTGQCEGGVMHLQWANKRRLVAKHCWYKLIERLRWPDRDTPERLNFKYGEALDRTGLRLETLPEEWIGDYPLDKVNLLSEPWHEKDIQRILSQYGRDHFRGLNLLGY